MDSIVTNIGYLYLTGIINSANFLVVIIALIIVFFLIGLILGLNLRASQGTNLDTRSKRKQAKSDGSEAKQSTDTLGQDNQNKTNNQDNGQDLRTRDTKNRYYNNYWY